jgi:TfoX/Sxy family transcriptional regulator of competence genes
MGQISDSFIAHVADSLAPWAAINARRMFSSWGLYRGALMFALVSGDVLYLKCGARVKALAAGRELVMFTFEKPAPKPTAKKGPKKPKPVDEDDAANDEDDGKPKIVTLSYAAIPADVMDDQAQLLVWAEAAWQDAVAARRDAAGTKPHSLLKRKTQFR